MRENIVFVFLFVAYFAKHYFPAIVMIAFFFIAKFPFYVCTIFSVSIHLLMII